MRIVKQLIKSSDITNDHDCIQKSSKLVTQQKNFARDLHALEDGAFLRILVIIEADGDRWGVLLKDET